MVKRSQEQLYHQLEAAADESPETNRDLALELLALSLKRQYLDLALHRLSRVHETLQPAHRPILRDKAAYYFENPGKDMGGNLREGLIRLLVPLCQPDDAPLLIAGIGVYERQPVRDVAQNLRAIALAALAGLDLPLASAYAVRLLGEDDTSEFNGEPSITAINVLLRANQPLPIYGFLLLKGERFLEQGKGEVVARAFELLGADFPPALYRAAAERFTGYDLPAVTSGIIDYIVQNRVSAFYPWLQDIIKGTRHPDLHRYGLIMMATARDETLRAALYAMAKLTPLKRIEDYIEAVELTSGGERDALLAALRGRKF
jgi:hypothetical protein